MTIIDWIISICALIWLGILWLLERSLKERHSIAWIIIPFLLVSTYRVLDKQTWMIVVAAVVVMLVAERRHLQSRILEWMIVLVAVLAVGWMLFMSPIETGYGIIGIVVFWLSWELHAIEGKDAILLLTCQILWPGMDFITAVLIVILAWALIVRIRKGGWLKWHSVPGIPLITISSAVFLAYSAYKLLPL